MTYAVNSISNSLFTTISSNSTIVSSGVNVFKEEPLNSNLDLTPWVGVYTMPQDVNPHRININQPWMVTTQFMLVLQETSFESGQEAQDRLDRLWNLVYAAINLNRTLDGTVLHITNMNIEPRRDRVEEEYFFEYEVVITAEVQG